MIRPVALLLTAASLIGGAIFGGVLFVSASTSIVQLGADIDGEAADDYSGRSVSLSSDGTTVAIGAIGNDGTASVAGHVRVYEWNSGTSSWDQKGADIDGEAADDDSGYSVSLSSDGTEVAIGANNNDGTASNAGHVRVYSITTSTPTTTTTTTTTVAPTTTTTTTTTVAPEATTSTTTTTSTTVTPTTTTTSTTVTPTTSTTTIPSPPPQTGRAEAVMSTGQSIPTRLSFAVNGRTVRTTTLIGDGARIDTEYQPPVVDNPFNIELGASLTLNGTGFTANTPLEIWIDSTPTRLATLSADPQGEFTVAVQIPDELDAGDHTLRIEAVVNAEPVTVRTGITLVSRALSSLPVTGSSDITNWSLFVVMLGLLIVISRRRVNPASDL